MPFARLALSAFDSYRRQLTQTEQADLLDLIEEVAQRAGHGTVEFIDLHAAIRRFERCSLNCR